ncbi:translation termination factor GTPase eRF3 [Basidiobolus ranarum]|uniref:Eukaryotic peptide chain release factor GTP-binding subunit n=1 Tax=Basidiobolus ranarum TaxID=34480 RepID=A0ABR2VVH4_9FUNG
MSGNNNGNDVPSSFSKLTLNAGASEFKPNPKAREFVPTWMPKPSAPAKAVSLSIGGSKPESEAPAKAVSLSIGGSKPESEAPAKAVSLSIGGSKPESEAPAKAVSLSLGSSEPQVAPEAPKVEAPKVEEAKPEPPKAEAPKPKVEAPKPKAPEVAEIAEQDKEDELLLDEHFKEHVNVIFIGHVDAGKSTMGGNILFLTGMVDKRTMEKYEREAKEQNRESWYLSWALDTNAEERNKGKTVECGRAFIETDKRRYTILDAPGHKNFVPSMIGGASQADLGVLVISARKGEFETGFERGGQTREHAVLAKTSGVRRLIVVINKMDDPTVAWSKERYDECVTKLTPFLKQSGYNPKTDLDFMPVSGYTGANIKDRASPDVCPWYSGPSLLELLDNMQTIERKVNSPLMMPITEKYKDMGTIVVGKIESGKIRKGQSILLMPNKKSAEISAIYSEEDEVELAICGDNVRIRLRGVEEEEISVGFVMCDPKKPVHCVSAFEAQLAILEHKSIICAGYNAVLHVHASVEEASLSALLHLIDKKTGRKSKRPPQFVKKGQKLIARIETSVPVCVEVFDDYPQLGRFTLRDEGKTIAIGKITKLVDVDPSA